MNSLNISELNVGRKLTQLNINKSCKHIQKLLLPHSSNLEQIYIENPLSIVRVDLSFCCQLQFVVISSDTLKELNLDNCWNLIGVSLQTELLEILTLPNSCNLETLVLRSEMIEELVLGSQFYLQTLSVDAPNLVSITGLEFSCQLSFKKLNCKFKF